MPHVDRLGQKGIAVFILGTTAPGHGDGASSWHAALLGSVCIRLDPVGTRSQVDDMVGRKGNAGRKGTDTWY